MTADEEFERFKLPNPFEAPTVGELRAEGDPFDLLPAPDLQFEYEPAADLEAGVTSGHVVVWDGKPGPASVASAAMLVDDDGTGHLVMTSGFTETTVVDDSDQP